MLPKDLVVDMFFYFGMFSILMAVSNVFAPTFLEAIRREDYTQKHSYIKALSNYVAAMFGFSALISIAVALALRIGY